MKVSDVMSRNVGLADPNMSLREAAVRMRDENVGSLPVGENDRLIGMITDRDIAIRGVASGAGVDSDVRSCMSDRIYYCYEDQTLAEAAEMMADLQVHRLPVLNRDKRLVGIVALADLARAGQEGAEAAKRAVTGISEPAPA